MYELLYTSVANYEFSELELSKLVEEAISNNKKLEITGMLVYTNREFIQILEGEEQIVKALYKEIESDERHTSVSVFYEGEIKTRAFVNWSMGFKVMSDDSDIRVISERESCGTTGTVGEVLLDCPNVGKELFLSLRSSL